jgi:hypothetical protein
MSYASERIKQNRLTAGRCAYAARQTREVASAEGMGELMARCDTTEQAAVAQYKGEREWAIVSGAGDTREGAASLDAIMDAAISAPEALCQTHLEAGRRGIKSPHVAAAKTLVAACYPLGVRAITGVTYEEQLTAMRALLDAIKPKEVQDAIALLGVGDYFQIIHDRIDEYELAIRRLNAPIQYRQVEQLRAQSHEELCELIALILSSTPGVAAQPLRARLLAPIDAQTDAQRDQRRAKAPPTDINPVTEVEEPLLPIAQDPDA